MIQIGSESYKLVQTLSLLFQIVNTGVNGCLPDININASEVPLYSQFNTYYPGDKVNYNGVIYICLSENGYKFDDIRIPMVGGWIETETSLWQPIVYPLWTVVEFEGAFYTLMTLDGFDNNIDPLTSDCWGAIADYDSAYNNYELSDHEYVVYGGCVFYPETDVNADVPELGNNLSLHDPRNYNIKKHMVRWQSMSSRNSLLQTM